MLGKNFKLGWGIYIYTPDNVSLWKFTRKWKSKLKTGRPSPPPPLGSATRTWAQDDGRAFGYVLAESRPQETVVGVEDLGQLDVEDLGQLGVFLLAQREPVLEVVAEVVAREGPHGEGVVHDLFACGFEECITITAQVVLSSNYTNWQLKLISQSLKHKTNKFGWFFKYHYTIILIYCRSFFHKDLIFALFTKNQSSIKINLIHNMYNSS